MVEAKPQCRATASTFADRAPLNSACSTSSRIPDAPVGGFSLALPTSDSCLIGGRAASPKRAAPPAPERSETGRTADREPGARAGHTSPSASARNIRTPLPERRSNVKIRTSGFPNNRTRLEPFPWLAISRTNMQATMPTAQKWTRATESNRGSSTLIDAGHGTSACSRKTCAGI